MAFFPLLFRLHGALKYLIWIGGDRDAVVVDDNGSVPTFTSVDSLRVYARSKHYSLEREEPAVHNLDWVASWCANPASPINCNAALEAWNLFSDLARSVGAAGQRFARLDLQATKIYRELFLGSNLPVITPPGESYTPKWSSSDLHELMEVLRTGLNLFQASIFSWSV
jgi:hypothetical protein